MPATVSAALQTFFNHAKYPIVFTGAGVSARAGLPTWKKLVEELAEGIKGSDPLITQLMNNLIKDGDYTTAIDYFNMSPRMLAGDKEQLLHNLLLNYAVGPVLPVAKLQVRGCLTTNFDRSILDAFAKVRCLAPRDYKFGDVSFKRAQWEENFFVARIHGSAEVPNSMVLSGTQFKALLDDEAYVDLLRMCFTQRNVLFLGFSFYDPAVRHVFNELERRFGSASPGRHLALLASDAGLDFIKKAGSLNIKVVQYNSANDHDVLWEGLNDFTTEKTRVPVSSPSAPKTPPFDFTKRYLAACFARARALGSSTALRESVLEGIVSAMLQEVAPGTISRIALLEKIRIVLGVKGLKGESILDSALSSLAHAGLCRMFKAEGSSDFNIVWVGEMAEEDSLDSAISVLTKNVKSRAYLQEGWETGKEVQDTMTAFFNQLIRKRGWDLGAAFAARRPPERVAIESLLNHCAVGISAFDRERLGRVCESMLQHPSEEEAVVLNELGRVSFAVEMAFQSPRSVLLHEAILPRVIYFDASVLLPALVEGHPLSRVYQSAIKRLRETASSAAIQLKIKVCSVYLNEIIGHRNNAIEYSKQFGDNFPAVARSEGLYHGASNINVYVGAYGNWIDHHEPISFAEFLTKVAPYTSGLQLKSWLVTHGFEVFDAPKGPKYPDFYAFLEKAYAGSLAYGKGPILIEHDAIQLSILDTDELKGEKALFITADRKLQAITAESKFPNISEMMISHVGLVQFIELLLGGMDDDAGLTELLWNSQVSDRARGVRSYFTNLALQHYDEGMAMAMPSIIEEFTDAANKELERIDADLNVDDPKKRANAFRVLGSFEKNYLAGMHEAVKKLQARIV